jgi:hypothetical protein
MLNASTRFPISILLRVLCFIRRFLLFEDIGAFRDMLRPMTMDEVRMINPESRGRAEGHA